MGLSRCAIYVKGVGEYEVLRLANQLGLVDTTASPTRFVPDQSEIGDYDLGIAVESGWAMLFLDSGPLLEIDVSPMLSAASTQHPIFMWLTQSTSGGLWFEYHEAGAMVRKWVEVESEVAESLGQPLAEEPAGFFSATADPGMRDENSLLALSAAVTGISEDRLFSMPFATLPRKHL